MVIIMHYYRIAENFCKLTRNHDFAENTFIDYLPIYMYVCAPHTLLVLP